jgi:hypothetical protein
VPPEPVITYFGLVRADDTLVKTIDMTPEGLPIFARSFGSNFSIVIEARPGGTNAAIDSNTLNTNPVDPRVLPGLQIEVSRSLGDGSSAVCDDEAPTIGGVPAIEPSDFSLIQKVADAINDLACRFKDGSGFHSGRNGPADACTTFPDGGFRFITGNQGTTTQFCAMINEPLSFPPGDTLVTARVRDIAGNISAVAQIVVRIPPSS